MTRENAELGGQRLVIDSTPTMPTTRGSAPDGHSSPNGDSMRDPRSEVNAYASEMLVRLLTIVNDLPARRREELTSVQHEIREMLAFIDPATAASIDEVSFDTFPDDDSPPPQDTSAALPAVERLNTLIDRIERVDVQSTSSIEMQRDLRTAIESLRDELRTHNDRANQAIESLTSTTRSLHYTITAISARSEQVTDYSGIAAEQLRVGVWKYALVAGLSGGAFVAAVVAFLNLVV